MTWFQWKKLICFVYLKSFSSSIWLLHSSVRASRFRPSSESLCWLFLTRSSSIFSSLLILLHCLCFLSPRLVFWSFSSSVISITAMAFLSSFQFSILFSYIWYHICRSSRVILVLLFSYFGVYFILFLQWKLTKLITWLLPKKWSLF